MRELDLHDNNLSYVPHELGEVCPNLQELNLNGNPLVIDQFESNVDQIAKLENLSSLYLQLTQESQVDMILRKIPNLEMLNGLEVDRDELLNDQEDEEEVYDEEQQPEEELDNNVHSNE